MSEKSNVQMQETKISSDLTEAAVYVNVANLAMSPEEIVVRFGLMSPDQPLEAAPIIRIYMSPGHAKRLAAAFRIAIEQYEANFGIIKDPSELLTPEARERLGMDKK